MTSYFKQAYEKNKLGHIEAFIPENLQYECKMGSQAYGTNTNETSDTDIYGMTIAPKSYIFPHTAGYLVGFDDYPTFHQFQKHHIQMNEKEFDFQIYNIVKYFELLADNNPNVIDSLFVPNTCVTKMTEIADKLRRNRKLFLHKGSYHRYRGYAHSQKSKIRNNKEKWEHFKSICDKYDIPYDIKEQSIKDVIHDEDNLHPKLKDLDRDILEELLNQNPATGKRKKLYVKYDHDSKYGYHLVRLMLQAEQILMERDLDLRRNKEMLKNIRNGEWSIEDYEEFFERKESELDKLYQNSDALPHEPDQEKIKGLLMDCLRSFFNNLEDDFVDESVYRRKLNEIKKIVRDV